MRSHLSDWNGKAIDIQERTKEVSVKLDRGFIHWIMFQVYAYLMTSKMF